MSWLFLPIPSSRVGFRSGLPQHLLSGCQAARNVRNILCPRQSEMMPTTTPASPAEGDADGERKRSCCKQWDEANNGPRSGGG